MISLVVLDKKMGLDATVATFHTPSQEALERFAWSEIEEEPTNLHAAVLMLTAMSEFKSGVWAPRYFSDFRLSMHLPLSRVRTVEASSNFTHLQDAKQAIDVFLGRGSGSWMQRLHRNYLGDDDGVEEPYILRKSDLWVTTNVEDGVRNYVRSRFIPTLGLWSTVVVNYIDASLGATLIISSIEDGPGRALRLPSGSRSDRHMAEVAAILSEEDETTTSTAERARPSTPVRRSEPEPDRSVGGSGTGFFVNADGAILTNAHVVDGCISLTADGRSVEVLFENQTFDLAVLRASDGNGSDHWLPFAERSAGLNADITIAGYPLHGLLGGLNVTRGTVSGLKGLGGDETTIQISAPVQPGNSGGPMVNKRGEVVGVVVAKLDAVRVADAIGDMPQNINFAVRGELAKMVLSANGIGIEVERGGEELRPEEVAERLQGATVLIECR